LPICSLNGLLETALEFAPGNRKTGFLFKRLPSGCQAVAKIGPFFWIFSDSVGLARTGPLKRKTPQSHYLSGKAGFQDGATCQSRTDDQMITNQMGSKMDL
jgi:hypothetical protein